MRKEKDEIDLDEIELTTNDKIMRILGFLIVMVIFFPIGGYVIVLTSSLPSTYSCFLPLVFIIVAFLLYLFLFSFVWGEILPKRTSNEKYKAYLRSQCYSTSTLIKIVGVLAFFVSLQAAYPLFQPKVSLTTLEDMWGVVDGNEHYVTTFGLIKVRPPLFPLHGVTNSQDIQFGTNVRVIYLWRTTPLMRRELLEDNKTIRLHVNADGWKYDVIDEKITYEYEQRISVSLNHNIIHLHEKRAENIDNKTVYYGEIEAYNYEYYPLQMRNVELVIGYNTSAWKTLYESAKKGQNFEIAITNENLISRVPGRIIKKDSKSNCLEFKDFEDGEIRVNVLNFIEGIIEPRSSQKRVLLFIPE